MTHGVAATSGHLASNGGLRGHSVGEAFPFIPFLKGYDNYCVRYPDGSVMDGLDSWLDAEEQALHLKGVHEMLAMESPK